MEKEVHCNVFEHILPPGGSKVFPVAISAQLGSLSMAVGVFALVRYDLGPLAICRKGFPNVGFDV